MHKKNHMKGEGNLTIFFIALIIFFFCILPMISSSQEKSIGLNQDKSLRINLLSKMNLVNPNDVKNSHLVQNSNSTNINDKKEGILDISKSSESIQLNKKPSKISIENSSPVQNGQKIGNAQITDLFLSPDKKLSLFDKKNQLEINPSLEDTYLLKTKEESKNTRNSFKNVSKKIPRIINEQIIEGGQRLNRSAEENGKFNETKNYASKRGYYNYNSSIKIDYDTGAEAWVSLISSNEGKNAFLVEYSQDDQSQSFLVEINFSSELNKTYVTYSGSNWGVIIDWSNGSLVEEWGHHSCSVGDCFWYGIQWFIEDDWLIGSLCTTACTDTCIQNWGGMPLISCSACIGCIIGLGGGTLLACEINSCAYYPCQYDCNDGDHYNDQWEYRCVGDNIYKKRFFYDYSCSSTEPMEGECQLSSTYYLDDQLSQNCAYGCSDTGGAHCLSQVECYSNLDCGQNGWTGNPYCSGGDVWQYHLDYTCHNAGTQNSYCTSSQNSQRKQDCTSGTCSNAQCVGDVYCQQQDPNFPFFCSSTPGSCYSCADNNVMTACCPTSGAPTNCCSNNGPFCNTNTGACTICGGDVPDSCNNKCWQHFPGFELCCPASGDPMYACDATSSVCMSNGDCCAPSQETCNNIDDNCDGTIDNFNEGCGVGRCAGGTRTCTTGNWDTCSTSGNAQNETCNNIDDNCDGQVDENVTQECGIDVGTCRKGTKTCGVGLWSYCGGDYVGPTNETCNGLDDNCNGITDEDNVCGNYPNITLSFPQNNYVSDTGNITFNCSVTDDVNLANITLFNNFNGSAYLLPNETRTITGTNNFASWTFTNLSVGNYMWNCLAYDNDSHLSWSNNGPFSFTVTIPGLVNTFADGTSEKILDYNQSGNQTVYIKLPKKANILNSTVIISGNLSAYTADFSWINWSYPISTNFNELYGQSIVYTPDNPPSGIRMYIPYPYTNYSIYEGYFSLNFVPQDVKLTISHLSSSGTPAYSPVDIYINSQLFLNCFNPGSGGYVTHEWDITPYVQQGENVIDSFLCTNATTHYWTKWLDVNSTLYVYPNNPNAYVNISTTNISRIWNYSGNFSMSQDITNFEDELNNALSNCTEDIEGNCNISLIMGSNSRGKLKLSNLKIYYNLIDDLPNVILISPQDNYTSNSNNLTFMCNATDDNGLSNIKLYTNISGIWEVEQIKSVSGIFNSTEFEINNLADGSFVWGCSVIDNIDQESMSSSNHTLYIDTNTAPEVVNLTISPLSIYRGDNIEISCLAHDDQTSNGLLNVSIQYMNSTNNGFVSCNNLTFDSNGYWKCNYTTSYFDDDLGNFSFRCNVSDGILMSNFTTITSAIEVLNNLPIMQACSDANIYGGTNGSQVQINLDSCSSDLEDSNSNLTYQILNQTNSSLINCYLNERNITCNNPLANSYGYSYLEVQVNDTDGGISNSTILVTVNLFPDTSKFFIQNSADETVAWMGDSGNLLLKGVCSVSSNCVAPADSWIVQNSSDSTIAYVDSEGNMCISKGNCSNIQSQCNPSNDAFIIQDSLGNNKSYIDSEGSLCLTGGIYENANI